MKDKYTFYGMIILSCALIISAVILSRPKIQQEQNLNGSLNGTLSGTLGVNQVDSQLTGEYSSDILLPYDASKILGFDQDTLIAEIQIGNPNDIPYFNISGTYLFSKKALEEWVYNKSLK